MQSRNLLLCFDAFGTLFKPRYPVINQYADVARTLGHDGFSDDDVGKSFRAAFKSETKQNPNYGKANGLNAEMWWTNIIRNTFKPLIGPDQPLHEDLIPKLLNRFWCDEGYTLFPDVIPLLQRLREAHQANNTRMVVGVITNSDDRVPDILASLGMRVRALRYGTELEESLTNDKPYDIDFHVMSYDVGHEKPDRRMFVAAEELLGNILAVEDSTEVAERDPQYWRKVYVGDEYDKDVVGATGAGWNAVLVEREETVKRDDVTWLDERTAGSLYEVFETSKAVGFSDLVKLAEWLPSKP